ncbi:hypothetical protein L1987_50204 [Smallanthus sonchifolius]|uniref:Uncharacterized protein n=1 Tax=Smallanthus sonchifolius TaxID=185202 RepID=A0ACB9FXU3_9ASTR|nr:hypothetical protein L1987_50204 [Smallanthus sonchifolius]
MVKADRSSDVKYKGVRKRKWGKWVSEVRLPNSRERIWLGSYDTPEKAARAFDAALFCLRGNTSNFNFPHQPPDIPGGRSLSPSQIQAAAARYANHHRSSSSVSVQTDPLLDDINNILDHNSGVPDFGIYPGFDDYFMITPPPATNYEEEEICDGIFLWNF